MCVSLIVGHGLQLGLSSGRDGSPKEKGPLNRPKYSILTTLPIYMLQAGSSRHQGYISEQNKLKSVLAEACIIMSIYVCVCVCIGNVDNNKYNRQVNFLCKIMIL